MRNYQRGHLFLHGVREKDANGIELDTLNLDVCNVGQ